MGAFLGETFEGERMERFLKPIRDLFGAIFFTSVGMLVDLGVILEHWESILILSFITIIGKTVTTAVGALAGGQDRRTALQAGLSLGQIGEFSFIIAALGLSLNAVRPELYPLSVSVAIVTTFATPYLIRVASQLQGSALRFRHRGKVQTAALWDGHIVELEIHPHFSHAGETLQKLKLREKFGVSLVAIVRGDHRLIAPKRDAQLMPFDRIVVLGSDNQLAGVQKFLQSARFHSNDTEDSDFELRVITLGEENSLSGQTLRETAISDRIHGMVVGIERGSERLLNPDSLTRLKQGDRLWIYGKRDDLRDLEKKLGG
jgi:Trk K+ transport system NAD-binding subunit